MYIKYSRVFDRFKKKMLRKINVKITEYLGGELIERDGVVDLCLDG
jgi:hypothetical protein